MKLSMSRPIERSVLCVVLVLLALSFTALPGTAAPRAITPDFAAIDRYVEQERQATNMPGLALGIVQGDQVVHLKGFGVADPSGRAVTPQTPFIIGSLTKSFTALAIMQLVEAGKVDLDAPVQRYLPWFRVADEQASARIIVRHLLNQTSGLPTTPGNAYLWRRDVSASALENEVRAVRTISLTYPPGTTYQYCNLNFSTLGLIVQTVTGETYEQYVQEHILAPLGMHNSFASPDEAQRNGLSTGYKFWFGRPVPVDEPYNRAGVPAGFISASAEDMAHYLVAQLNGGRYSAATLLSAAGIAELHRPAAPRGSRSGDSYAMGWAVSELNGVPTVWHEGSTNAFKANMILVPEGRWGIVVLQNGLNELQGERIDAIATGVMSLLVGRQPPPAPSEPSLRLFWIFLGVCVLQLLSITRSVVLLRRWRAQPERRPRGAVGVGLRVGLPLALNLLWALFCLIVLPQMFEVPLSFLVLVDLGLVVLVSGAVALVWGLLRAVLAFFVLRTPAAPKAVTVPASA
jgi:CubicO group peptidase (beta-lactamase class C family)